ncbi:NB-ARC domain-containing protein [Aetokthonos hydrillicola Thurmond2011]|jgi:LuxR family glucitol operon transcriptional activator|uniref:NB-ARC domain-containing protein n=1 Tax=Aetokthonos hydrillicola Thurmond2011 TaxID=2712845 RepID=A0AAP5IAP1_9CYAN|nr:NB-ARC domain-containing protein [Aetokthonos hydrillicola]MBO3461185.1 AAA family ATPase [Aetokthonos hydrillicola CCALA 1050]MBW4588603.1 AAA family ATPase [Aetokthonos hydrillicola CCALA 1050]MDR9896278.1 NB-ARC domain-containing protein [Aetokthonos hydrillicola Thurmond2011]
MLPRNFLSQMANEHQLSKDQEQVFLMRMGDGLSYEQIAAQLSTSPDACLKRMGQVYKKFNISGASRGKENKLRFFLTTKLEQLERLEETEESSGLTQLANLPCQEAKPNLVTPRQKRLVYQNQNLPAREYTAFVGRTQETTRLMELLDFQHPAHLISVDGIGGVGKTTLVVEVAYRCLEGSHTEHFVKSLAAFEAIIFTSAKQNHLTSIGILPRLTRERTLRDICREIARVLDLCEITNLPLEEQFNPIREKLSRTKTLLIVDNLETIEDQQEVLSFLYDLPPTVKVIITTREQALFVPIRLGCLPREHGLRLIEHEVKEKGINLSAKEQERLFDGVSGIPGAIIYAVGQMAGGYLLEDVLAQIREPEGDVARFCFAGSVIPLRGTPPHHLLMALSLGVQPVTRETAASVAFEQADPAITSQGLAKLQQLSLVYQHQGRYSLLECTREYAAAELAFDRELAQKLQQRWVNWYIRFSEAYGGTNWREWSLGYGYLEAEWENLRAVLEWCISQARYSDVRTIWQHIKGYIHIRGYWDERLDWSAWLIEAAKQAGDWVFVVEVMSDRATTLIRMRQNNQLQEAEALLQEAWNLRENQTITMQLELATNMVILYINQQQCEQAQEWLQEEEKLLEQANLPELQKKAQLVHILYYRGQISFKAGDYLEAQNLFQQALVTAQEAEWQRAAIGIQNWLADVALQLGNLVEARRLLELSFPIAERHKDKHSIAYHKASFAKLEKLSLNLTQAKRWAKEAAEGFESLRMATEATEMRTLFSE